MCASAPRGFILYRGPSQIDGSPIVAIAITGGSGNVKTGDVVQTYILVDNGLTPNDNIHNLADAAICGACPHRRGMGGACYVNTARGPAQVFKQYQLGRYPFDPDAARILARDRIVRLGTYGDPAAVPCAVWDNLTARALSVLGYSHQWRAAYARPVMRYCMASCDSEQDRIDAHALGFRTFRVRRDGEPIQAGEFTCPASAEAGHRRTCSTCRACHGGIDSKKADATIVVHGMLKHRFIPIACAA